MDSTDSVVMGGQKKRDTLAEMPRFGGRNVQDGEVFPVWLKELTKKVKFDVGDIGVRIIKGEVRRGDIKTGDRAYDHRDLIQLCLTKGGRGVTVFTKVTPSRLLLSRSHWRRLGYASQALATPPS